MVDENSRPEKSGVTHSPPIPSQKADVPERFRPRDSMGALRPSQAEIDAALARGYAEGLEAGRLDTLDQWRTVLAAMLESKFGELGEPALVCIEDAEQRTIEKWMVAAIEAKTLDDVFTY